MFRPWTLAGGQRIRVKRNRVEQGCRAAARAIRVADLADEHARRVGACVVVAGGGEREPKHPHARHRSVQDVVTTGEQRLVRRGRDGRPVAGELWIPEQPLVGLVPDRDVADRAITKQQIADEPAVRIARGWILRRVGTRSAVDGQENPQPRRRGHSAIETTHLDSVGLCLAEAPLRRQPQRARTERPRRIGRLYPDLLRQVVCEADHELSRALRRRRRPHRPQRHHPATPKQDHDSEEHAAQG